MTKRCKHDWQQKPDYPEDIVCSKCQTIKPIRGMSHREFARLPVAIRRNVLEHQAAQFIKDNPEYFTKE